MLTAHTMGFFAILGILGAGCGASSDVAQDQDSVDADEQDLSAASVKLAGTYTAAAGPFRRLELTASPGAGARFVAEMAGMTTAVEGTFSAGASSLTLRAPRAPAAVRQVFGRYRYTLAGSQLALNRSGSRYTLSKTNVGSSPCEDANFVCVDAFSNQGQCPAGMAAQVESCNPNATTIVEAVCCAPTPVPPPPPPPPPPNGCQTDADCSCDAACITPGGGLPSQCTPRFPLFCAVSGDCPAGMLCKHAGRKNDTVCSFKECLPQP